MDKTQYRVFPIRPGVTGIDDCTDSTSYLIEGEDRALLIDTGWGDDRFVDIVRGLTDKPIALAMTHMHADHTRHAEHFSPRMMHPDDIALVRAGPAPPAWSADLAPLRDGDSIDLGGLAVSVIAVPGHTPGSLAFLDARHGLIFTGDAIGSGVGVWMQVSTATPLSLYREILLRLLDAVRADDTLVYYGGHIDQCGAPDSPAYNPLTTQTVRDMIALTEALLEGRADATPFALPGREWPEQPYVASHGKASIVYLPSSLK